MRKKIKKKKQKVFKKLWCKKQAWQSGRRIRLGILRLKKTVTTNGLGKEPHSSELFNTSEKRAKPNLPGTLGEKGIFLKNRKKNSRATN